MDNIDKRVERLVSSYSTIDDAILSQSEKIEYLITIYRGLNESNNLDQVIRFEQMVLLELNKIKGIPTEIKKESVLEKISKVVSIITNPIQWYTLARNEYLKIKEREKNL